MSTLKANTIDSSTGTTITIPTTKVLTVTDNSGISIAGTAVSATAAQLNVMASVTASATELNVLDGIPAGLTATELGYSDGVTSAIQTQVDAKLALAGGTLTGGVTTTTVTMADNLLTTPVIKDFAETVYAGGNTATAKTLAETNGNVQTWTMTGNCTFTMPSGSGLQAGTSLTLILTQDGTGSRTGAFTGVKWAGATAPTLTTTATTGIDIITFTTFNGGASPVWYGFASGMAMA